MAEYIKYRFKSFNGKDYDTYHLESRSSMILRFDEAGAQLAGNKANVESSLSALESSVSTLQNTVESIVSTGGQPNVIEGVKVNGTKLTPDASKNVDIPAATATAYGVVKVAGSVADGGTDPVTGDAVHSYASAAIAQTTTNKNAIATLNGADNVTGSVAKKIKDAIGALDVTDNAVTNNFVTAVSETDGKIKVSRAVPTIANVSGLTEALNKKIETSQLGVASGVATLGTDGKILTSQLPSYVDDVIEGYKSGADFFEDSAHTASKKITGETGKIYVDLSTNVTYRWSGTAYVEISASLALGETGATAYRGDRGKIAYDHSQSAHARTDATAVASSTTNGKIKINGAETTVYSHPTYTSKTSGLYKITVDATGHVSATAAVAKADLTGIIGDFSSTEKGLVPSPGSSNTGKFLRGDGTWQTPTDHDTKNTAGATNTSNKIFLIGATTQGANPQTYTQDTAYVGTDGCLYSNGHRVIDIQVASAQPSGQVTGDFWLETLA